MKTTVEISDGLFDQVKQFAQSHDLTLRQVFETGLRKVIAENPRSVKFQLRDAAFRGDGMVQNFSWPEIKAIMRDGRGD